MLTQAQLRLYRAEWGKCRKALRQYGRSPAQADEERKKIHVQAKAVNPDGSPKSSLSLNNGQLDKILAIFWTWSRPADLGAQIRQENQTGIRARWICNHMLDLMSEVDAEQWMDADQKRRYIDSLFSKLNPKCPQDPDWAEWEEWEKVHFALVYRYDQVFRKALGRAGETDREGRKAFSRKRVEFHPERHDVNLKKLQRHQAYLLQRTEREQELVAAGHTIDHGDPF